MLSKIENRKLVYILIMGILLISGCGSDRAGNSVDSNGSKSNVLSVNNERLDSDGDGLSDQYEVEIAHTNPNKADSDGDGLSDSDEINVYETNASNPDTDNDGLKDGEEVHKYGTNALNSDTDGDCLLDSYEVKYYETNATNRDTDGDLLPDGIEIYSYVAEESNVTCISHPETLESGYNKNPAIDNLQSPDTINALDPHLTQKDTDGDGIGDKDEVNLYGTNPLLSDSDGDGLKDSAEIYTYETNATNPDTDDDGLKDGAEVLNKTEPTNPLKKDSDNDGILDLFEVEGYKLYNVKGEDLNATNPDTDGDCLLDGFEVMNYKTNPNSRDTDSDSVEDGIEVYGDIETLCLKIPEKLSDEAYDKPAQDNIPTPDKIDALDPTNDSDGDGQANVYESSCSEGNATDMDKFCPYIHTTEDAVAMIDLGYAYVPGGFDVDGDGTTERGFWMSRYQARRDENTSLISSEEVTETVGIINNYISEKFKVVNKNVQELAYMEEKLDPTSVLAGSHLLFDEKKIKTLKRISSFTPYLAEVSMSKHALITQNGKILDLNVTIPTHKQYVHVKKLLDADLAHGGDGRHIRNGLLGIDPSVPIFDYTIVIDEFGETKKEYVRNMVQLVGVSEDTKGLNEFNFSKDAKEWWEVNASKFKRSPDGASSTQDLGFGIGVEKDPYAVIVRGGGIMDLTLGVSGADTDEDDTDGVSFRAATPYFE